MFLNCNNIEMLFFQFDKLYNYSNKQYKYS